MLNVVGVVRNTKNSSSPYCIEGGGRNYVCTAPAAPSYPSLKNIFNGCQGHLLLCLSPRTAQGLPDQIQTMFRRATFIQLSA
jgi:hypothetical protein